MKKTTGVLVVLCLATLMLPVSQARTIMVTNTNVSGPGSLSEAIGNAGPGNNTIQFHPSLDGQLISGANLSIHRGTVTVMGRGPDKTIIKCSQYYGSSCRVFKIGPDAKVVMSELTITGGHLCGGDGAGILNHGDLRLEHCNVDGNETYSAGGGTGPGDFACDEGNGGGIANFGTLTVNKSTVSRNDSIWAGGIYSEGTLTIMHSTISQNAAGYGGVAILSLGTSTMTHSTVAGNWADEAGIWGTMTVSNSIVADNLYPWATQCGGNIQSLGHNLDSDGSCNFNQPTDLPNTDPMLGPLADNGGPTWTHALLEGSPAIDAGSCPGGGTDQRGMPCPLDMPDLPNADDGCDIGAVEYSPFPANVQVVGDLYDIILILTGEDNDLVAPLQEAIQVLEDGDPSNDGEAVGHLQAFIAEVEDHRGLTLTDAEADELITEAQRIIGLLNFGGAPVANN